MSRLWMEEGDGERWLINPLLSVANPRKRRVKKMAVRHRKARRNRMPAGLRRYWAKHRRNPRKASTHRRRRHHVMANPRRRRRAHRNYTSAGMVAMNPHRRHHYRKNKVHHRRRARRNPSFGGKSMNLFGITIPPLIDIAAIGTGLVVAPMVANYAWNNFIAGTSIGTSKWAYIGVEAASVVATGYVAKRFINSKFGNMLLVGGFVKVAMDLVNTLAPSLIPSTAAPTGLSGQPFLGVYEHRPVNRGPVPGLGVYYNRGPGSGRVPGSGPRRMIATTADRLDPTNRF
jgi:hypothetical protein